MKFGCTTRTSAGVVAGLICAALLLTTVSVANATLSTPVLTSPAQGAVSVSRASVAFQWDAVAGADVYRFRLGTDTLITNPLVWDTTCATNSRTVQNLQPGTKYYWRVRAKNTGTQEVSSWSTTYWFITDLVPPSLEFPGNGAVTIDFGSVAFQWNDISGANVYRFRLGTDTLVANAIVWDTTCAVSSRTVTGLQPNTKYFWRVRAKNTNSGTVSSWSQTYSFTTAQLTQPALTYPANNAPHTGLNFSLQWNAVWGANVYRVRVGTDSLITNPIVWDTSCATTSKQLTNLSPNTKYYWRVRAKNTSSGAVSAWSPTWNFTTENAGIKPPEPSMSDNLLSSLEIGAITPNPAAGAMTLKVRVAVSGLCRITVCDAAGRPVLPPWERAVSAGDCAIMLDVSSLPAGKYFVRAGSDGATVVRQFVVER